MISYIIGCFTLIMAAVSYALAIYKALHNFESHHVEFAGIGYLLVAALCFK